MSFVIVYGPTQNVGQWLDAVKPDSSEILLQADGKARLRATFSDDAQTANSVAAAIVTGIKVEQVEQSGRGSSWLILAAAVPAAWFAWKWWRKKKR